MNRAAAASSNSTPHTTRSQPPPRRPAAGESMALAELDIARAQRWYATRVPEHARHQVRVECQVAPRRLTIVERRAPWREDLGPEWTSFPIARRRYTAADKSWTLYWRDATSDSASTTCSTKSAATPPASSAANRPAAGMPSRQAWPASIRESGDLAYARSDQLRPAGSQDAESAADPSRIGWAKVSRAPMASAKLAGKLSISCSFRRHAAHLGWPISA